MRLQQIQGLQTCPCNGILTCSLGPANHCFPSPFLLETVAVSLDAPELFFENFANCTLQHQSKIHWKQCRRIRTRMPSHCFYIFKLLAGNILRASWLSRLKKSSGLGAIYRSSRACWGLETHIIVWPTYVGKYRTSLGSLAEQNRRLAR